MIVPAARFTRQWRSLHLQEPHTGIAPSGHLFRTGALCAFLCALAGCFETEYGPLIAGRPVYELIHLEESYDAVCAIPSTAVIDTSLDPHPEHRRNMLDYSIDEEGREVVRNHAHEAYGFSDFHAERRPDYDDERGEAWLTFIHGEHVQEPPEGEDFWVAYRSGADCHPDNNLMLFPYAVDPEPPQLDLVVVPVVVDGVKSDFQEDFRRPFYDSIIDVFGFSKITLRADHDMRIDVPSDSVAVDLEAGTIDYWHLIWQDEGWTTDIASTTLYDLFLENHRPGEVFVGYIDGLDPEWVERFGDQGLWARVEIALLGLTLINASVGYHPEEYPFLATVHEIGHTLSLGHAPCGVSGADPNFPDPQGGIDGASAWSEARNDPLDFWGKGPLASTETGYYDVMSYCEPQYIAPYHFKKALEWQRKGRREAEECEWDPSCVDEYWGLRPVPPRSLVLSGYLSDAGVPVVTHVAASPEPPIAYAPGSEYIAEALSEHGDVAASASFGTTPIYREDGSEPVRAWGVRLPFPESVSGVRIGDVDGIELSSAHIEMQAESVRLISR